MSYFGKKSLIWWDYYDHSKSQFIKFNNSDKKVQLAILEKWYPIGAPFKLLNGAAIKHNKNFFIEDYKLNQNGTYNIIYIDNFKNFKEKNPILIEMDENFIKSIKRQYKIEKILKSG